MVGAAEGCGQICALGNRVAVAARAMGQSWPLACWAAQRMEVGASCSKRPQPHTQSTVDLRPHLHPAEDTPAQMQVMVLDRSREGLGDEVGKALCPRAESRQQWRPLMLLLPGVLSRETGDPFLLIGKKGGIRKEKTTYDPEDEGLHKQGCYVLRNARYSAKFFPCKISWPFDKIAERCLCYHSRITLHS